MELKEENIPETRILGNLTYTPSKQTLVDQKGKKILLTKNENTILNTLTDPNEIIEDENGKHKFTSYFALSKALIESNNQQPEKGMILRIRVHMNSLRGKIKDNWILKPKPKEGYIFYPQITSYPEEL